MKMFDALIRLKEHKRIHHLKEPTTRFLNDAFELAFEAMGKQVPMKPYKKPFSFICGNCQTIVYLGQAYCLGCGQAQYWDDVPE